MAEVLRKWRNKNKFARLTVARALSPIKCAVPSGNSKESHNNKNFIEVACSVRTVLILVSFFFCKFINLQKRTRPIFSQNRPHASSITSISCAVYSQSRSELSFYLCQPILSISSLSFYKTCFLHSIRPIRAWVSSNQRLHKAWCIRSVSLVLKHS